MHSLREVEIRAKEMAQKARISIVEMTNSAKASHVGSALSVVDILAVLYAGGAKLSVSPDEVSDTMILSKGHAASALYAILVEAGFFPKSWLENYCANGKELGGHVTSHGVPGVTLSTGSLGHGMPYGLGIAMARKIDSSIGRVFVIMSDGECDEGTTWESALLANQFGLKNLCVIIDRNRIQSLGPTESTISLEPLADKWAAFGWTVRNVDGHSYAELLQAIQPSDHPLLVIADTTKGKGVSFMEDSVLWHYKSPEGEYFKLAMDELLGKVTQ